MGSFDRVESTAQRLKKAMQQAGKKQVELARAADVDKGALSSYLSGKYEPKQDVIYRIAKVLNVSEMWLWGYDCPQERPAAQKNNDAKTDIVVKLRTDEEYFSLCEDISRLNPEQLASVKQIVAMLLKD